MGDLLVGVDGGGTATTCLVATRDGQPLGQGRSGPGNWLTAGPQALAHVRAAVAQALAAAGARLDQVGAACLALAGIGVPEARAAAQALAAELFPAARVYLTHDAEAAWAGATGGQPGCVVIAGTGSVAYGKDATGREARAGGWGWLLGDEGSGFDLGRRALAAVLAAHDGRGPATALTGRLLARLQVESPPDLVARIHRPAAAGCPPDLPPCGGWHPHLLPRPELAALAEEVLAAAAAGDPVALDLVAAAAHHLAALAAAVLRRLDLLGTGAPVCTAGGLFRDQGGLVAIALARALAQAAPGHPVRPAAAGGAAGAVLLAGRLLGDPGPQPGSGTL